jgi:hypothetical protein
VVRAGPAGPARGGGAAGGRRLGGKTKEDHTCTDPPTTHKIKIVLSVSKSPAPKITDIPTFLIFCLLFKKGKNIIMIIVSQNGKFMTIKKNLLQWLQGPFLLLHVLINKTGCPKLFWQPIASYIFLAYNCQGVMKFCV